MKRFCYVDNQEAGQAVMVATAKTTACCILVVPEVKVEGNMWGLTGRISIQMKGFPVEGMQQLAAMILHQAAERIETDGEVA